MREEKICGFYLKVGDEETEILSTTTIKRSDSYVLCYNLKNGETVEIIKKTPFGGGLN